MSLLYPTKIDSLWKESFYLPQCIKFLLQIFLTSRFFPPKAHFFPKEVLFNLVKSNFFATKNFFSPKKVVLLPKKVLFLPKKKVLFLPPKKSVLQTRFALGGTGSV